MEHERNISEQHALFDVLYRDPRQAVLYMHRIGDSEILDNHLASVTIEVAAGVGFVATKDMRAQLQVGDTVRIEKHTPYWYGGELGLLMTFEPAFIPETVSINGKELSRRGRRIARDYEGYVRAKESRERMFGNLFRYMDLITRLEQTRETVELSRTRVR